LVCIVTTIGDHTTHRTYHLDQLIGNADVADVAGCEADDRRATQNICHNMDFYGQTTA
jgi:hypothetical protein